MIHLYGTPPANYNYALLQEEANTAWGPILRGLGQVDNGDGTFIILFTFVNASVSQSDVNNLLAAHDGEQLSQSEQVSQRSTNAKERLVAIGADGVRQMGVPEINNALADLIEFLGADL